MSLQTRKKKVTSAKTRAETAGVISLRWKCRYYLIDHASQIQRRKFQQEGAMGALMVVFIGHLHIIVVRFHSNSFIWFQLCSCLCDIVYEPLGSERKKQTGKYMKCYC